MDFKQYVADVQDFPEKDILFRDITPLMGNGPAFHEAINEIVEFARE
ncbi:MAG: adenine phosphoribosyltransferase, partial [Aerococcus viridans]